MPIARRTPLPLACTALALAALGACSSGTDPQDGELTGVATMEIANAPADVACIEVNVAGNRTVDKKYDVTPGQSSVFTLTGLPVGAVTFNGSAFSTACASVTSAASPNWISDPVPATLVAGVSQNIRLSLRHNGRSTVTVDFDDGDAAVDAGSEASTTCTAPMADCNGSSVDGCETNVSADVANCGACGMVCASMPNATTGCMGGTCAIGACNAGFANCNGMNLDGCEVNVSNNPANCGACGVMCPAGYGCVAGACISSCTDGIRNGSETDVDCGGSQCAKCSTGKHCSGSSDCVSGTCIFGMCQ